MFKYRFFIFVILFSFLCLSLAQASKEEIKRHEQFGYPALKRLDFNNLAVENKIPVYWYSDESNPGILDPNELVTVGTDTKLSKYVKGSSFTKEFENVYGMLVNSKRHELVKYELKQGRPTLIYTDLSNASKNDKAIVSHIVNASKIIEKLYQIQKGGWQVKSHIPKNDLASNALYKRNQGVWCEAPETENSPFCTADPTFASRKSDAYPENLTHDAKMCEMLRNEPNGKELMNPFTVVRNNKNSKGFRAVPLTEVYAQDMKKIARELKKAAAIVDPVKENAFRNYLLAAAEGFETNNWEQADEAWSKMSPDNSKWYLRIAPDEVYFDPCQVKAGFHVSFALISKDSKVWKEKLMPLRKEMENKLAKLIGPSYKARDVSFQMPEFIDIVLNAGDSRDNLGATVGQSLPNWGPVAKEGRGRTVAMTNFYTDPDSMKISKHRAALYFGPKTLKYFNPGKKISLLNTVLHEAVHNLGPHKDSGPKGKSSEEVFGGRMASILEELKAQTGSLWFVKYLNEKGLIDKERLYSQYVSDIFWCFNHLSRGLFTAGGNPKVYSQLSAVQIGTFIKDGALKRVQVTDPETKEKSWRFEIEFPRLEKSVEKLMKKVSMIKAQGNLRGANQLVSYYVKGKGLATIPLNEIGERFRKFTKASFYYSVKLD